MSELKLLDCVENGAGTCRNELLFEAMQNSLNGLKEKNRILAEELENLRALKGTDEIERLTKELEEEKKWRPMSTAPLDGTFILLLENGEIYKARWQKIYDSYTHEEDLWAWCIDESYQDEQGGYSMINHPSKWKPLPQLPRGNEK